MNPRLLLYVAWWMLCGPGAETLWESWVRSEAAISESGTGRPPPTEVVRWWRGGTDRLRLESGLAGGIGGLRLDVRLYRERTGDETLAGLGVALSVPGQRLEVGALRGGLGSGLLLGLDGAWGTGVLPAGAWSRLPGPLRSGPPSTWREAPPGVVLAGRGWTTALVASGGRPLLALALKGERRPGVVVLLAPGTEGVEVVVGRTAPDPAWRLGLAAWRGPTGSAWRSEAVLSLRPGPLRGEVSLGLRSGDPLPLAAPGAGRTWPGRLRLAAAWRGARLTAAAALEGWMGDAQGMRTRTRERGELTLLLPDRATLRLRWSRTCEREQRVWQDPAVQVEQRVDVGWRGPSDRVVRSSLGGHAADGGGVVWLRLEIGGPLRRWLMLARLLRRPGPVTWFYEPAAVRGGRMVPVTAQGWRVSLGVSPHRGLRAGLTLQEGRSPELVVGWRWVPPSTP